MGARSAGGLLRRRQDHSRLSRSTTCQTRQLELDSPFCVRVPRRANDHRHLPLYGPISGSFGTVEIVGLNNPDRCVKREPLHLRRILIVYLAMIVVPHDQPIRLVRGIFRRCRMKLTAFPLQRLNLGIHDRTVRVGRLIHFLGATEYP